MTAPDAPEGLFCQPADQKNSQLLAYLHAETFPGDPWNATWMATLTANPANAAIILYQGGEPVGLSLISAVAGEAEILTIGIVPSARRSGLGALLLRDTLALAATRHSTRLFLEVSSKNRAALALYEKAGFARTGLRRKYYSDGSDAVTMAIDLTPAADTNGKQDRHEQD